MTEAKAAEIEKLIELLEKATGPDRELDALITIAANARPGWAKAAPEKLVMRAPGFVSLGVDGAGWEVPLLTKSIDAALTLVVPDTQIEMIWGAENHKAYVELIPPPTGVADGVAVNPAIALCIAALRALSHKGASND